MSRRGLVPAELDLIRRAFDGAGSWGEAYERLLPVLDGILEARAGDFAPQVVIRADRAGIVIDVDRLPATGLLIIREADVPPLPELWAVPAGPCPPPADHDYSAADVQPRRPDTLSRWGRWTRAHRVRVVLRNRARGVR